MSRWIPKKRSSASFSRSLKAGLLAVFLSASATAETADPYYDLIYDFETASFCGLIGKNVYDAFWAKRRAFEAATDRATEELRQTRIRAMANAEREFDNRGLGGHKPWCRGEVAAGVARLLR